MAKRKKKATKKKAPKQRSLCSLELSARAKRQKRSKRTGRWVR